MQIDPKKYDDIKGDLHLEKYGYIHGDLHPNNIRLSIERISAELKDFDGKVLVTLKNMPFVKLIDPGWSQGEGSKPPQITDTVAYWKDWLKAKVGWGDPLINEFSDTFVRHNFWRGLWKKAKFVTQPGNGDFKMYVEYLRGSQLATGLTDKQINEWKSFSDIVHSPVFLKRLK